MSSPTSFAELFKLEAIVPELQATTKPEALAEMVASAVSGGALPKGRRQEVIDALLVRETRGTTGLGKGIAIPHAKIDGLRKHAALVARSGPGVDFRAVDGEPVYVFVMLISPATRNEEHLAMLKWVSTLARDPDFTSFIRQAQTREDIFVVLEERSA